MKWFILHLVFLVLSISEVTHACDSKVVDYMKNCTLRLGFPSAKHAQDPNYLRAFYSNQGLQDECRGYPEAFECIGRTISACPEVQKILDKMGFEMKAAKAGISGLCSDIDVYESKASCITSKAHEFVNCQLNSKQAKDRLKPEIHSKTMEIVRARKAKGDDVDMLSMVHLVLKEFAKPLCRILDGDLLCKTRHAATCGEDIKQIFINYQWASMPKMCQPYATHTSAYLPIVYDPEDPKQVSDGVIHSTVASVLAGQNQKNSSVCSGFTFVLICFCLLAGLLMDLKF